jgi:hypothetical protein
MIDTSILPLLLSSEPSAGYVISIVIEDVPEKPMNKIPRLYYFEKNQTQESVDGPEGQGWILNN